MKKRLYLFTDDDRILLIPSEEKWSLPDTSLSFAEGVALHDFSPDEAVGRVIAEDGMSNGDLRPCGLRETSRLLPANDYQRAGKAWELLYWSEQTRFCGCCGAPMRWHTAISRVCDSCGQEVWPQLNTAIIVLVHKGDEALLVKAKTFRRDFFGLVAGFVETGESLEECVAREVREETSLLINHIRYFGSQPWPYPLGLMIGFHADYVSGKVTFADGELKDGRFFRRDSLPMHDDGSLAIPGPESMARRLIDDWMSNI
ncbi:MAG: NAD(+) diphosphatase [Bacteroidaceae bacterium]|nr:NAD(+) diphosphatase [Bacteroidaceae bacterium]